MHADVLAGISRRLKPHTEHFPKPMVPFLNRPMATATLIMISVNHEAADI